MSINDKLNQLKEIKGNIKTAIIEKGVEVSDIDSFNSYADKIRAIPTGGSGPVIPLPEIVEWEKPADWIDLKDNIPEGAIRYLVSDMYFVDSDEYDVSLTIGYITDGTTINWGDGTSYVHDSGAKTIHTITHKFNNDYRHEYIDRDGFKHGQYMIEILFNNDAPSSTRSVGLFSYSSRLKCALWCVNNYFGQFSIDMESQILLESYEIITNHIIHINRIIFRSCKNLRKVDFGIANTSNMTTMSNMFSSCSSLTSLDLSNFDTSNVTSLDAIFVSCSSLTSLDLSNWDTSKVTNMSNMFDGCSSLTSLDLSNFDTSNVTSLDAIFVSCSSLTSLDLSNWDTSKVTNMNRMFDGCSSLISIDVSKWDTGKLLYMSSTFKNCSSLISIDVSNFDTSRLTTMASMFEGCSSLTSIDLSKWDTSKVTNMNSMFKNCSSLISIDVSNFDTSKVTIMDSMFYGCSSLTSIDVSKWDTGKVTSVKSMFYNCSSLFYITPYTWDFSNFTGSNYSSSCSQFLYNSSIKKLCITLQNSSDFTSSTYIPFVNGASYSVVYYADIEIIIPRPTFSIQLWLGGTSTNVNQRELQRVIIRSDVLTDFTSSSPQINLDYTFALKADAINEFFTNLPAMDPSKGRTISIKGNPHAHLADTSIATSKGWTVLYDTQSISYGLRDRYTGSNTRLYYRLYPDEEGQFVNANGESCNLLWTKYLALNDNSPMDWELHNTFSDALDYYGLEVQEEYREEMAKDVLAYASDDSLMVRYNIED